MRTNLWKKRKLLETYSNIYTVYRYQELEFHIERVVGMCAYPVVRSPGWTKARRLVKFVHPGERTTGRQTCKIVHCLWGQNILYSLSQVNIFCYSFKRNIILNPKMYDTPFKMVSLNRQNCWLALDTCASCFYKETYPLLLCKMINRLHFTFLKSSKLLTHSRHLRFVFWQRNIPPIS